MNVLFVCTENVARSRAAETLFHRLQGQTGRHEVRSVGTASHAARRLTTRDLVWADVIAVMEPRHLDVVRRHWPHHAVKVVVLDVFDLFLPEELELREALEAKVGMLLERCDTVAAGGLVSVRDAGLSSLAGRRAPLSVDAPVGAQVRDHCEISKNGGQRS